MEISRRHFLEIGSLAAAACAVPVEGLAQERGREARMPGDLVKSGFPAPRRIINGSFSESNFRSLVGQNFTVKLANNSTSSATLDSVEVPTSGTNGRLARTQSFLLHFHLNSGAATLKQGTYDFSHRATGKFSLFIVPFSANGSNTTFTATVSNMPA